MGGLFETMRVLSDGVNSPAARNSGPPEEHDQRHSPPPIPAHHGAGAAHAQPVTAAADCGPAPPGATPAEAGLRGGKPRPGPAPAAVWLGIAAGGIAAFAVFALWAWNGGGADRDTASGTDCRVTETSGSPSQLPSAPIPNTEAKAVSPVGEVVPPVLPPAPAEMPSPAPAPAEPVGQKQNTKAHADASGHACQDKPPAEVPPAQVTSAAELVKRLDGSSPKAEDRRLLELRRLHDENRTVLIDLMAQRRETGKLQTDLTQQIAKCALLTRMLRDVAAQQSSLAREIRRLRPARTPILDRELYAAMRQNHAVTQELGAAKSELGNLQLALGALQPKVQRQSDAADALLKDCFPLYDAFGRLGPKAQARAAEGLSRWIVEDAEYAPYYLARGFAWTHGKQYDRALSDFDRAAELFPPLTVFTTAARGYALALQGELRRSTAEFNSALKAAGQQPLICLFRGHALLARGKHSDAQKQFLLATRYDKGSADAHQALAYVVATNRQASSTDLRKALQHAKTACGLTKWSEWWAIDTLAMAHAASGDYQAAVQTAKQALHIAPAGKRADLEKRLQLYMVGKPYRVRSEDSAEHQSVR